MNIQTLFPNYHFNIVSINQMVFQIMHHYTMWFRTIGTFRRDVMILPNIIISAIRAVSIFDNTNVNSAQKAT